MQLTADQQRAVEDSAGSARRVAKAFARRYHLTGWHDDLVGEAHLSLCLCAAAYDPKRSPNLMASAMPRIRGSLYDWIRRQTGRGKKRPDVVALADDPPHEFAAGPDLSLDSTEEFDRMFAELTPKQQRLMRLRFVDGLDCKEAALAMGDSHARALTRSSQAYERIRRFLSARNACA